MSLVSVLSITLAAIFALGFSFFQYLYKNGRKTRKNYIFFGLRSLSVFILLLLLINPKITTNTFDVEKPELILAVDNSASIKHLNRADSVRNILSTIKNSQDLQERFSVQQLNFGKEISVEQNLNFDQTQTNISSALNELRDLTRRKNSAILLISDGNQTLGRDYQYFNAEENQAVIPVVIGDTTQYFDLELSRLNVNRYSFLDNRFPVEAIINYNGNEPVSTKYVIRSGDNVIYSEDLNFDAENSSAIIKAELPASRLGVLSYEAEILPLDSEKNKLNNARKFAVEVIDERTNVLVLTAISHPDLGAFKQAVESNRQRKLEIKRIDSDDFQIRDYQLVILYQPNNKFKYVLENLQEEELNHLIVTGTQTNWNFLNSMNLEFQKESAFQSQEIFAEINPNFNLFQFKDIGFKDFPPLEDKFGSISSSHSLNPLFFQKIEGEETNQPLFAISEKDGFKKGMLFGENIWRWRAASFVDKQSFADFDNFFGKIVQNLSSQKRRERLTLDYESFYYANQEILIKAQYFDENYQLDHGAALNITFGLINAEETTEASMLLKNSNYEVDLGSLSPGEYEFTVQAANSGISKSGTFSIINFDVEQQFSSANLEKLQYLAQNNREQVYFPSGLEELTRSLTQDNRFAPVQKSREKSVPLIDWYYLLFLLVLVLALEWFFRKYSGLI